MKMCFTSQSGASHGYLNRWCLDPNDPLCPETAPNFKSKQVGLNLYFYFNFIFYWIHCAYSINVTFQELV